MMRKNGNCDIRLVGLTSYYVTQRGKIAENTVYVCALLSAHTDTQGTKGKKGTISRMSDQANDTVSLTRELATRGLFWPPMETSIISPHKYYFIKQFPPHKHYFIKQFSTQTFMYPDGIKKSHLFLRKIGGWGCRSWNESYIKIHGRNKPLRKPSLLHVRHPYRKMFPMLLFSIIDCITGFLLQ